MNPMNPSKELRKFQETKEHGEYLIDRISAFSDIILTQILSSLPTKDAVATSILSKRWKLLWTNVLNLDFTYDDRNVYKFVRFVNHVLRHHNAPLLHNFRLFWKCDFIPSHVNSWITTAIARNVCQLVLCVLVGSKYQVPTSIFSCQTLKSLELKGVVCVPDSVVVCLPKLETLKFVSVYFKSKEAFRKIICQCPMLNYLYLHLNIEIHLRFGGDDYDEVAYPYIISSTSLRRLELGAESFGDSHPCEVELEASSLEYLKLEGYISEISVLESLSSLVEATCRIVWSEDSEFDGFDCSSLVKLVRAFDCAKSLTLATHVMWGLSHTKIRLSTKFSRLKKLTVGVDSFYCRALKGFLQSSDTLEVLTIHKDSIERYLPAEDSDFFTDTYDSWTAPAEVPRCLSNTLKSVLFDCYSGFDDESEMIGYMLKHGSALEVMHITFEDEPPGSQSSLAKKISNLPRKSTACEIKFSPTSPFIDPMGCEVIM